jgi:hypothetical protein
MEYLNVGNGEMNFLKPELIGIYVYIRPMFHLCITDLDVRYSLQSTGYSLQTTGYRLQTKSLEVSRIQTTEYSLQTRDYSLQTTF